MNSSNYFIEKFKIKTLNELSKKKEKYLHYKIDENDIFEMNSCNICGSKDIILISQVYLNKKLIFNATSACNNCLFTFRSRSPSLSWFIKCWKLIENNKLEVFRSGLELCRKKRYLKYYNLTKNFVKGFKVLDIGAAYGTGAKLFVDKGYDVDVIEPDNNKFNYLTKKIGLNVVARYIEDVNSSNLNYDLIILANCLEHLDDPFKVLQNINSLLNVEGILYLDLPILWRYITWSDSLYLTHKSYFSEENLEYFVNKAGFTILKKVNIEHENGEPLDIGLVLKKTNNNSIFSLIKNNKNIDDIFSLYCKGLPLEFPEIKKSETIRYNVPYIEQFYQTLKLTNYDISISDKFIEFNIKN